MKRDQVLSIFPEATEEQLKSIMDLNGNDINAEKAKRTADKEEIDRLKEIEKEFETLKGVNQTAEEKAQKEMEKALKLQKDFTVKMNKADAISILAGAGYAEAEYSAFIDDIVSEDADKTKRIATSYATTRKAVADAAGKQKEADLLQGMTPPPAGSGGTTITKEQFKNMSYQQMAELKASNPALFTQLNS